MQIEDDYIVASSRPLLPCDAVADLTEIWKRILLTGLGSLTIREALWAARLRGNIRDESEDRIEKLSRWSKFYASRELACHVLDMPNDTIDLDARLAWDNSLEIYDALVETGRIPRISSKDYGEKLGGDASRFGISMQLYWTHFTLTENYRPADGSTNDIDMQRSQGEDPLRAIFIRIIDGDWQNATEVTRIWLDAILRSRPKDPQPLPAEALLELAEQVVAYFETKQISEVTEPFKPSAKLLNKVGFVG